VGHQVAGVALQQAPFVKGLTLVNAGAFTFSDPLIVDSMSNRTLKNMTPTGP
jgi:hypothetical protein